MKDTLKLIPKKTKTRAPKLTKCDLESKFQSKVIRWLRSKGCFVFKMAENGTTERGIADIFFCLEGFYGFLEAKKAKDEPHRPGQDPFIKKMDNWSYAKFVYPENWEEVKKELEEILR